MTTVGTDTDDTLSQSEHFQTDISPQTYTRIFSQHGDGPARAVMVGNSLKSHIVPAIAAGSWGGFIPHALTWEHEHVEAPKHHLCFRHIERFADLSGFLSDF